MGSFTNGVYVPTIGEVGWGTNVNDFLTRSGQETINVKQAPYAAVGDGSHDDTAAIQAAIDAAVGGAMSGTVPTPMRSGSAGTGRVFIPAGTYKITAPLVVRAIQGLQIHGAGSTVTTLRVSGTFTQAMQLLGASMLDIRGFTIDGAGGYAGTGHVTYGMSWDWTPSQTVNSSYRSMFRDIWVSNLDFKYGWGIGDNSANFDVSGGTWDHCQVTGNFVPGDGTTTQWQEAFLIGSGTAGNVLNHYFTDCHATNLKHGWYVNNVSNVSLSHGSAQQVENIIYKVGPGEVLLRDMRAEECWRIADSLGGASFTSHLGVQGLQWTNATIVEASGRIVKWNYPGSVEIANSSFTPDAVSGLIYKVYSAMAVGRTLAVTLRNATMYEASTTGASQHIEAANASTIIKARFEGVTATNNSGSFLITYPSTSYSVNDSADPVTYTVTNPSTDRALNVTVDTTAQVAAVVGTLISDLKNLGLLQ